MLKNIEEQIRKLMKFAEEKRFLGVGIGLPGFHPDIMSFFTMSGQATPLDTNK